MHKTYGPKGVVIIAAHVEQELPSKAMRDRITRFLEEQKATFINLIVEETLDDLSQKTGFDNRPAVFVFDRAGRWRRFEGEELKDVDRYVEELLKN